MAAVVPDIDVLRRKRVTKKEVDAPHKAGHDEPERS
jgi:hypothetical protein